MGSPAEAPKISTSLPLKIPAGQRSARWEHGLDFQLFQFRRQEVPAIRLQLTRNGRGHNRKLIDFPVRAFARKIAEDTPPAP